MLISFWSSEVAVLWSERVGLVHRIVVKIERMGLASPCWAEKREAERMLRLGDDPDEDCLAICPDFRVGQADQQLILVKSVADECTVDGKYGDRTIRSMHRTENVRNGLLYFCACLLVFCVELFKCIQSDHYYSPMVDHSLTKGIPFVSGAVFYRPLMTMNYQCQLSLD